MDPFLGLGSSAVAAADLQLDFIGVELDEHYLKEALGRVKAVLNAKGLFGLTPRRRKQGPSLKRSPGPSRTRRR
jgi:hypothetical protein